MTAYSYTKKNLRVSVTLDGSTEQVFDGFATRCSVTKTGCPDLPKASVTLRGLALSTMEGLTRLAFGPLALRKNALKIEAGEAGGTLSTIFTGEITTAWADFNAAPSVEFRIEAASGIYPTLTPQSPISVVGEQSAPDTIEALCKETGYSFENNGVSASISNCILEGDPVTKMKQVASQCGFDILIDDSSVVILPRGSTRAAAGSVPLISADTGMIGYPAFSQKGISVTTFFNPALRVGAEVRVESIVPRATGSWKIASLRHDLAANDPGGGPWRTSLECLYIS